MVNRLFVTSLKSIGLVVAGDNPESEVLLWKMRHIDTIAQWNAIVAEERARNKRRLADIKKDLDDLNKKIENVQSTRLANIPDERNPPMTMTDKEPQELNEMVIDKLDAYARKQQFEGEMKGAWGHESTPREQMVTKIRARWWDTPDGQAVKDLLRERGGDPADLTTIAKSHSEPLAALGRLDG